jgi:hypothetical protein
VFVPDQKRKIPRNPEILVIFLSRKCLISSKAQKSKTLRRKKAAKIRMVFYTMKRGTGNTNIFKILKPASQGGRENLALERVSIP